MKYINLKFVQSAAIAGLVFISASSHAAGDLALPTAPLILSNAVEPNIFFVLDDSYSMHWETMMQEGVAGLTIVGGDPKFGTQLNGTNVKTNRTRYFVEGWLTRSETHKEVVPPPRVEIPVGNITTEFEGLWAVRNHNANAVYYNPNVDYKPWAGTDPSGNPYADADVTKVLQDPNKPAGLVTDLTTKVTYEDRVYCKCNITHYVATYYTWADKNGNGEVDADEQDKEYIIPDMTTFPTGRSQAKELLNFANWLQYYRSRYNSAKASLGQVINDADNIRIGLDVFLKKTLNYPKSMTNAADKTSLLDSLYAADYDWQTPTRSALIRVGDLYKRTDASKPDPILPVADGGACQQNFAAVVTDGFWTNENTLTFIDADSDNDSVYDGKPTENDDKKNYADGGATSHPSLADIAMHYYETDLRSDDINYPDIVPIVSGVDEATHQHMITYGIAFGVKGTKDPEDKVNTPESDLNFWPTNLTIKEHKIDDLWHAAYNGRGEFLSANNPVELQQSLNAALSDISKRTSSSSAVAINSARLTSESVVYLAQFNSDKWLGTLAAFKIADPLLGTLATTPYWEASGKLDARDLVKEPRQIITFDGTKGVPFTSAGWINLSSDLQSDLQTNPTGGSDTAVEGKERLEFIRGDRSLEGIDFRTRGSLLGDLVNSGPVYVGAPTLSWPDVAPFPDGGSKYSAWKNGSIKSRDAAVYIGGNDGMLHAFKDAQDSSGGKELFAYVPNLLASSDITDGYHYLSDPGYTHNWYVDQTPTVSDVFMSTNSGIGWRTILIGGVRGGGRGLFALDITNPNDLTQDKAKETAMWEFSNADDPNLGYTYSRPVIGLANNGRWIAVFGNGYNDTGSGTAQLFILDIESGIGGWSASDYQRIDTGAGSTLSRNGLASPALADLDGNGTIDRVYAGDLEGNMWAFDLSSKTSGSWGVASGTKASPVPLFKTLGKPITAKPVLAKHPDIPDQNNNTPNVMVFFGTGQYLVGSDKVDKAPQSFFGIWDNGDDSSKIDYSNIVTQKFATSGAGRILSNTRVSYPTERGWQIELDISGERAVTSPIARAGVVFFNTFVPELNPCSIGGFGYRFAVDMANGGSPEEPVFDLNDDGVVDEKDKTTDGVLAAVHQLGFLPEPVFIEDIVYTGKTPEKIKKLPNVPTGRFSWQELIKHYE